MALRRTCRSWFEISILAMLALGCSSNSSNSTVPAALTSFPLGAPVTGVTLAGELSGKTMYLLPSSINYQKCWQDSAFWNGTQLFYGMGSLSYTGLAANSPAAAADPGCTLPSSQLGSGLGFNIYSASVTSGAWNLLNLGLNSASYALAAPKLDGNTLVAVNYSFGKTEGGNMDNLLISALFRSNPVEAYNLQQALTSGSVRLRLP